MSIHTTPMDQATRLRRLVARPHTPSPLVPAHRGERRVDHWGAPANRRPAAPILSIASGKGGVGKTNIAVNLCASLALRGTHAILLDGDIGLANADVLCGLSSRFNLAHVLDGSRPVDQILLQAPGGFTLAPGAAGLARLGKAGVRDIQRVARQLATLEESAEMIVIDCGAGLGATVRTFVSVSDLCCIVVTPEPTSIADAYALIKCIATSPQGTTPDIALLINQARNHADALRVQERLSQVSERFLNRSLPLLGWVPLDEHVRQAVRQRAPFVITSPRSRASRSINRLGDSLQERLMTPGSGRTPRRSLVDRLLRSGI